MRVIGILNLEPRTRPRRRIDSFLTLGDDSFRVALAHRTIEVLTIHFNVVRVKNVQAMAQANEPSQSPLSLKKRQTPQIAPTQPEEIERVEDGLTAPIKQFLEYGRGSVHLSKVSTAGSV
jgi:hypothetical protein